MTRPEGFAGELRTYQAEALAWIGFLDAAELGGCLALDMGLGKTPTVLAHLARTTASGTALVVAPAAVVGNWAAEAARFVPALRIVVHHGASRSAAAQLDAEIADADVVITTYATAVRDVDALAAVSWGTVVLDEAQAIKNPTSDTAQQLRRIPARTRLALTGTPIENGLGDLWAILDFTNPGLVGSRPAFITQLSGDGESALRALNGLLLFRRTKSEPEVAAELPDKIDELDHCTMTAEQIGLYQAVLDELVTTVASQATVREQKKGAILAAITALKQICNHPAAYRDDGNRSRAAPASSPASRRSSRRSSPPTSGSSCSPTSPPGGAASRNTSAMSPTPRSPATTAASRGAPATDSSPSSSNTGSRRTRAVVEGRGNRPQPDGRQPRRALRPLVEPRRRGPGPRPRLAHRAASNGHLAPARVSRNDR